MNRVPEGRADKERRGVGSENATRLWNDHKSSLCNSGRLSAKHNDVTFIFTAEWLCTSIYSHGRSQFIPPSVLPENQRLCPLPLHQDIREKHSKTTAQMNLGA